MLKVIKCLLLVLIIFGVLKPLELSFAEESELQREINRQRKISQEKGWTGKDVQSLIKELRERKDGTRQRVILLLSRSKDPRAIEPLAEVMLNSKDKGERAFAAQRLSVFHDKKTIPAFKKALKDKATVSNAAIALYKFGEEKAVLPILEELAMKGNIAALHCFGKVSKKGKIIYDANAKQIYMKVLKGKNENSRIVAARHLVEMGEEFMAFPVAVKILKTSQKEQNKRMALDILEKIKDEKSLIEISKVQDDSKVGEMARELLYKLKRTDLVKNKIKIK